MGGENDVPVEGMTICGRLSGLTRFGPEPGGKAHDRGSHDEVIELGLEGVQSRYAAEEAGLKQLAPDFIVGDFRQENLNSGGDVIPRPLAAGKSVSGRFRIGQKS